MVTCPWSPSRPTELSPCQTSAARLSSAPRSPISTSSLPLLALPWRPPSDFAQTDIPAWPVCSCPEPLEVGDIWDHTGERKKLLTGSPELLWEMRLVRRNRQPRRAPSYPRQGEERRMAPGNRFLAKFTDPQTSETSAQNTEESGHVPLLGSPLLSPSLAPQAVKPKLSLKDRTPYCPHAYPHPIAITAATINLDTWVTSQSPPCPGSPPPSS